jgi:hypothetical protein
VKTERVFDFCEEDVSPAGEGPCPLGPASRITLNLCSVTLRDAALGSANMREVVMVSTARTGMAKAVRGSLNATHPVTYAGHVLRHAMERAGLDPAEGAGMGAAGLFEVFH